MGRNKTQAREKVGIPANRQFMEADLARWAGRKCYRNGRRDALLGRVEWLRLSPDGSVLDARVRGSRTSPFSVSVRCFARQLDSECTCSDGAQSACKHAVAAVEALRFPLTARARPAAGKGRRSARKPVGAPANAIAGFVVLGASERTLTRDERIALVRADERSLRRQRSLRRRYAVELSSEPGGAPRFTVVERSGRRESVCLRGPRGEQPSCTCVDFSENEIGTCEHVERVRRWYLRKPKSIPDNLLSLWVSPRAWTDRLPHALEELRVDGPIDQGLGALERWFDSSGYLRPQPAGVTARAWSEAALVAARELAAAEHWRFDLDPLVTRRIQRHGTEERNATDREALEVAWQEIVPTLGLSLHPYQQLGTQFLARCGRAFLADDMGLGKTAQSIVAALMLRRAHGAHRALVVCPASLKHQWAREIEKVCSEAAVVADGSQAQRFESYRTWTGGFLILNYELVLRDLDAIREAQPDLVILDEAQRIKNHGTKTAVAVKKLSSRWAFVLTGTPLENRLLELHSLVEFLHTRALGPRWRLRPFHVVEDAQGRVLAYEGFEVLRKRLRGFFLRRHRSEVLEQLPERTDNTFWTGMTPLQRSPYRRQAVRVAALVGRGRGLSGIDVQRLLRALTRMRILCNAHAQDSWELWQERLDDPRPAESAELLALGSPKLEEFSHVLGELLDASEEKVVVFSQWERMLKLAQFVVRESLQRRDLRAGLFHGGLKSKARANLLDDFRADPSLRVLFSTDAGGLGLNLQDAASIVVNLEVPWNPAVLEQRIGRVHRMGQQRNVRVLHFVTRGAIEEKVRKVLEDKRALFDGLLTDGVDHVILDEESRASLASRLGRFIDDEGV